MLFDIIILLDRGFPSTKHGLVTFTSPSTLFKPFHSPVKILWCGFIALYLFPPMTHELTCIIGNNFLLYFLHYWGNDHFTTYL